MIVQKVFCDICGKEITDSKVIEMRLGADELQVCRNEGCLNQLPSKAKEMIERIDELDRRENELFEELKREMKRRK